MRYDYYDEPDYTAADARADAAQEAWDEAVAEALDPMVQAVMDRIEVMDEDQPHPWTWDRHLLEMWLQEGESAVREELEEHFREEAEEQAREDAYNGPCCNDFHCPCGNSNNFRGF